MKIYRICDLRIEDHGTEWLLFDEGADALLLQGTREEVAARVRAEMA